MKTAPQAKQMAVKAVNKHEQRMHPGKPMTKMAKGGKVTRGNGAATKGTKAYGPLA
jgi:hypothetical protein